MSFIAKDAKGGILPPSGIRLQRRAAFPLHELYIVIVILALIAAALYFFAGAWGVVLLWSMGVLLLLPQVGGPIALFIGGMEKLGERQWPAAAGYFLGSLFGAIVWLAVVGYCGYRAYTAVP